MEILFLILYKLCFVKPLRKYFKEIYYYYRGLKTNELYLIKKDGTRIRNPRIKRLRLVFEGKHSLVEIHESCKFHGCKIRVANHNHIRFEESCYGINNFVTPFPMEDYSKILVGKNFLCMGLELYTRGEKAIDCIIGDNVMMSCKIMIWLGDAHTIFTKEKGIINRASSIKIGNNVWLGVGSTVLKGSFIPDNSIVGACSVYTATSFRLDTQNEETNKEISYIFAGNPAKIIKTGSYKWDRKTVEEFSAVYGDGKDYPC